MFDWLFAAPRRTLGLVFLACAGMLAFALYLQHVVGLEPCPMCIVQRYALILVGLVAGISALVPRRDESAEARRRQSQHAARDPGAAARQSWLQWNPPEIVSCGRDFYGMIETFPLKRAIPMIFRGSGDCTKIDWTFLGGSIANWSFVAFVAFAIVFIGIIARQLRAPRLAAA